MTERIGAQLTKTILKCGPSDDGKYGLIGFSREQPDSRGNEVLWIGVPTALLPHLAVAAIRSISQPELGKDGQLPAVFPLQAMQAGTAPDGQSILTLTFEPGASLSVKLDKQQAHGLAEALAVTLGRSDLLGLPHDSKPS